MITIKVSNRARSPLIAPANVGNFRVGALATTTWEMDSATYAKAEQWFKRVKTATFHRVEGQKFVAIKVEHNGPTLMPFAGLDPGRYLCLALCLDGRHRPWLGGLITPDTELKVETQLLALLSRV